MILSETRVSSIFGLEPPPTPPSPQKNLSYQEPSPDRVTRYNRVNFPIGDPSPLLNGKFILSLTSLDVFAELTCSAQWRCRVFSKAAMKSIHHLASVNKLALTSL